MIRNKSGLFFCQFVPQPAERHRGDAQKRGDDGMGDDIFEQRVVGAEVQQPVPGIERAEQHFKVEAPDKLFFNHRPPEHSDLLVVFADVAEGTSRNFQIGAFR